jgi:hypothetical protein
MVLNAFLCLLSEHLHVHKHGPEIEVVLKVSGQLLTLTCTLLVSQ